MKKILALLLFCSFQIIFSQNVFKAQKEIYLAQYYAHQKDGKKSLDHYLKAIQFNPKATDSYDYLKAAAIAFKLKDSKTAKVLLTQSITKQLAPLDFIKTFENLQKYQESVEMKEVLAQYDDLENQYYRELKNPGSYMEIQELIAKDQLVRENNKAFEQVAQKIDSANIEKLIELTKKYGWERRSWLLLWHHRGYSKETENVWNFFKPYLKKEIEKDNVEKNFFVDFDEFDSGINDFMVHESKGAIYTLRTLGNINGNTTYFDVKNIDKRRKSVGLPPLYFDHLIDGIDLPKDYEYNPNQLLNQLLNDLINL